MITLKQVEAFYWVGTLGSFAAAADKINVAQSTVSKRIQEMEMSLGIDLFDRDMRSGRLTLKGTEILGLSEKMLRLRMKFIEAAKNEEALTGTLRIGMTEFVAITVLPDLVVAIKERYPHLVIEPQVAHAGELYKRLEDRSIDLVIGPRYFKDDHFATTLLEKIELAWMCRPDIVADAGVIPLSRFKDIPLILQPDNSSMRAMINRLLDESGVRPKSVISCNGTMALAEMACAGLGITCLPKTYFMPEVATGQLRIVETDPDLPGLLFAITTRRDAVGNLGATISSLVAPLCDFNAKARRSALDQDPSLGSAAKPAS